MATPTLTSMQLAAGLSSGGDLVRLVGTEIADRVRVLFGGVAAEVLSVRDEAGLRVVGADLPTFLGEYASRLWDGEPVLAGDATQHKGGRCPRYAH